jgi:probable FeS assembly SUF system protein SufT
MRSYEPIPLNRDCAAIQIPAGTATLLPAGTRVVLQQSLGGTFTVVTDGGEMVRIAGQDADALGLEVPPEAVPPEAGDTPEGQASVEEQVWSQLRTVYDPEIPINIVDLGLVYACNITPLSDGKQHVEVTMTLTAPGCGMGDVLRADAESKILGIPGVGEAKVLVVVEPPWDRSRMSEAAKLQLGMYW